MSDIPLKNVLAAKIFKKARKSKNWTLKETTHNLKENGWNKLSQSLVSHFEIGLRFPKKLDFYAQVLDMTEHDLLKIKLLRQDEISENENELVKKHSSEAIFKAYNEVFIALEDNSNDLLVLSDFAKETAQYFISHDCERGAFLARMFDAKGRHCIDTVLNEVALDDSSLSVEQVKEAKLNFEQADQKYQAAIASHTDQSFFFKFSLLYNRINTLIHQANALEIEYQLRSISAKKPAQKTLNELKKDIVSLYKTAQDLMPNLEKYIDEEIPNEPDVKYLGMLYQKGTLTVNLTRWRASTAQDRAEAILHLFTFLRTAHGRPHQSDYPLGYQVANLVPVWLSYLQAKQGELFQALSLIDLASQSGDNATVEYVRHLVYAMALENQEVLKRTHLSKDLCFHEAKASLDQALNLDYGRFALISLNEVDNLEFRKLFKKDNSYDQLIKSKGRAEYAATKEKENSS